MLQVVSADNTWYMSQNLEFESLEAGWYTIGLRAADGSGDADYNVHVYSSDSPVHLYEGENQVTTEKPNEYVAPTQGSFVTSDGPPPPPPPQEPVVIEGCTDLPGVDDWGDGCDWYALNIDGCNAYDSENF